MKLGMNLLLHTTNPDESIFPVCERYKALGFDGLEWPLFAMDVNLAGKFRQFNEQTGLQATAVTVLGPDASPVSPDAAVRANALTTLKQKIDVAAALGAEVLCGPFVQALGHFTGAPPTTDEKMHCADVLREAGEYAANQNVLLVLEYLNRFEIYLINTASAARELCEMINHPNVMTMIDSFHANIEEKDIFQALVDNASHIGHIHISENDRGIPGSSKSIPWDDLFRGIKQIQYDRWLVIESFGHFLPDLAGAAKIWRPMFDNVDDVGTLSIAFLRKMLGHT